MSLSLLKQFRRIAILCLLAFIPVEVCAAAVSVQVGNNFFNQKDITVNVGDTVTWVWIGSGHDTVANDGTWNSGLKNVGASFSFTFTAAHAGRRFDYFCTPHRSIGMVGSITVRAAANQAPTVSLTAPGNGATFSTTDTITFSANAGDDAGVNRVEFYSDGNLIGTDTSAPYSVTASLPAGQHSITAKAFDGPGLSTTSGANTITVNAPANQPPTVSLTAPGNGQAFSTTDTITFSADANDDAGVSRVEFYSDGNLIGTDTSAPYSVTASLPAGQHSITAKAFDGPGLSTTSGANTITVNAPNQPPTVNLTAPANNATFSTTDTITFSADANDDVGVNHVEFYSDGNLIGTDTSAPYSVTASLPAGTHSITAKAFDGPNLSTTSTAVQIQVSATAASPHIDSIAINGVVVTITASATTGALYQLQATVDFGNWSVVNSATSANGSVTLNDVVNTEHKFYRVVAP
jgi:plastocyanin